MTDITVAPGWIWRGLGRDQWEFPELLHNVDGLLTWRCFTRQKDPYSSVLVSTGWVPGSPDAGDWIHASIAHSDHMPAYDDLKLLFAAVWRGRGWAYQVFAPPEHHVDGTDEATGHVYALHLWGRLDGSPVLPNFGHLGAV